MGLLAKSVLKIFFIYMKNKQINILISKWKKKMKKVIIFFKCIMLNSLKIHIGVT